MKAAPIAVAIAATLGLNHANAKELQAYAGVTAGIAHGSSGVFACATSGPTIGDGWFAGVALPTEGFVGCNLAGGIDNHVAAAGPVTASQTGSAAVEGGGFTGSAQTRTDYWSLGVAAQGTMTGGTSAFTYHQAAAFARFSDTLTLSKPGIATGTAGFVNFSFLVEGIMNSMDHPPYSQQGDIALGIRVNGRPYGVWYSFMGTVNNEQLPYVRGGSTGLPGSFVLTPGGLSGSASVTSTANFGIEWGKPFDVEVALSASAYPCCHGATMAIDFLHTARLDGIQAGTSSGLVDGFDVTAASGAHLGPGGLTAVPEPAPLAMAAAGIMALVACRRWSRRNGPA